MESGPLNKKVWAGLAYRVPTIFNNDFSSFQYLFNTEFKKFNTMTHLHYSTKLCSWNTRQEHLQSVIRCKHSICLFE